MDDRVTGGNLKSLTMSWTSESSLSPLKDTRTAVLRVETGESAAAQELSSVELWDWRDLTEARLAEICGPVGSSSPLSSSWPVFWEPGKGMKYTVRSENINNK